jgi:nucleoside 2-deoxyribosyltransferase
MTISNADSNAEKMCYFCKCNDIEKINTPDVRYERFKCQICGIYLIYCLSSDPLNDHFWLKDKEIKEEKKINERKALVRYNLWRINKNKGEKDCRAVIVDSEYNIKDSEREIYLNKDDIFRRRFPNLMEQLNYLVKFLGEELTYPGRKYDTSNDKSIITLISATISIDYDNLKGILDNAKEEELIKDYNGKIELSLTGWKKYEELRKGYLNSKSVFMAMQYDEKQIKFFKENIGTVVEEYELELNILPDIYKSENNIDLKLRNAIRESCLLICDLTHRNNGAYFEAGFAEGLGKPIIYVCERETFNEHKNNQGDRSKRLHFDIEHMEIYVWKDDDEDSIKKFKENLDAKIKAVIYSK